MQENLHWLAIASGLAVLAAALPSTARAQTGAELGSSSIITVARLPDGASMNGGPRHAVFRSITPLPLVVYEPVFGGAATERTEVRVAHDDTHLWVIAYLYDSDPSGIRANSLYRDRLSGDDVLAVVIDPFGDNESGLWLWTTPAGVRGDASLARDGATVNDGWNGFWDVEVDRSEEGWFAAMRIPFSTLGFEATGATALMGLTVYRYISRRNERHVFPAIAPRFDVLRPSQAQRIRLVGVQTTRPVYASPYLLGGVERSMGPTSTQGAVESTRQEAGLDVRYHPAPNLVLDATVNTDFAQVEADDQRVNLTRFSLFFPERRRFFQERSGVFEFVTGGSDRLFHSRQIGLRDGVPVPILAGARLVGRLGSWDLGMLDVQTAGVAGPAENFGVARARRRIFNEHSYAGALLTTRSGDDGSRNVAMGFDAVVRVVGDDYLTVQAAYTADRNASGRWTAGGADASFGRVTLARRRDSGVTYALAASRIGADYRPRVGFVERTDVTDVAANIRYIRLLEASGLRRIDPLQLFARAVLRNADGWIDTGQLEYNFDAQWRSGAELGLDVQLHYEDLPQPLELPGGVSVPSGRHIFPRFESSFDLPEGSLFTAEFDLGVGRFYDGRSVDVGLGARWNASRHLELTGEYDLDLIRFPTRSQHLDVHVVRLRVAAALDTHLSATAYVQYNDVARTWSSNVRLRYAFREGHDLWLVVDETASRIAAPLEGAGERRTLLLKYTRTFAF